jgi:hypothetical protein
VTPIGRSGAGQPRIVIWTRLLLLLIVIRSRWSGVVGCDEVYKPERGRDKSLGLNLVDG